MPAATLEQFLQRSRARVRFGRAPPHARRAARRGDPRAPARRLAGRARGWPDRILPLPELALPGTGTARTAPADPASQPACEARRQRQRVADRSAPGAPATTRRAGRKAVPRRAPPAAGPGGGGSGAGGSGAGSVEGGASSTSPNTGGGSARNRSPPRPPPAPRPHASPGTHRRSRRRPAVRRARPRRAATPPTRREGRSPPIRRARQRVRIRAEAARRGRQADRTGHGARDPAQKRGGAPGGAPHRAPAGALVPAGAPARQPALAARRAGPVDRDHRPQRHGDNGRRRPRAARLGGDLANRGRAAGPKRGAGGAPRRPHLRRRA